MPLDAPSATVMVSAAQLAQMQADQAKVQEMLAQREIEATAANIRATAASGQIESLARSHRAEIEAERNRAAAIAAKAELASALARQPILPHAVEQLTSILGSDITATPDGKGGFTVLSKDYRDVTSYVTATLAAPDFAHFRSDTKPAIAPVNRPNPAAPELPTEPKNHGEFIVAMAKQRREAESARAASVPASMDPSQSFCLGTRKGPAWGSPFFGR
jgi:hypothetical protein